MTSEIPPISRPSETKKTAETDHKEHVDPDKFRRVLKVEEADESQQRKQRQRTKQQEEVEEEQISEKSSLPPPTAGVFSSLMTISSANTSIFDLSEGTQPTYEGSMEASDNEVEASNQPVYEPQKTTPVTKSTTQSNEITVTQEDLLKVSAKQESSSTSSDSNQKQSSSEQTLPVETKKTAATSKKKQAIAEISVKEPHAPEATKPKSAKEIATQSVIKQQDAAKSEEIQAESIAVKPKASVEKKTKDQEVEQVAKKQEAKKQEDKAVEETAVINPADTQKQIQAVSSTQNQPDVKVNQATRQTQQIAVNPLTKTDQSLLQDQKKSKDPQKDKEYAVIEGASSTFLAGSSWSIPPTQSASYARLQSDVFELFRKMVGIMTIEQTKGVSKTTITLNMPGSVFDKCQVELNHYDTAPHCFNVQLLGNEQAVNYFNANMADLAAAFQNSRFAFEVNLQRPVLLSDSKPVFKRKEEEPREEKEKDSETD